MVHLTINCFLKILSYTYTTGNLQDLIVCKIVNYIPGFLGQVPKTLLVCACIDRYMITSKNAKVRAFSTIKRAKYITWIVYIFWAIIQTHLLFWMTMSNGQCTKTGWYVIFSAFYTTIFICLLPSALLAIFGYLTYRNMNELRRRIRPTQISQDINNNNDKNLLKRDRDLLILVLAEVIIYIITSSPFSIISIEMMITQFMFPVKSLPLIQAEVFGMNVAILAIFIFSGISFYTYIVVSRSFRQDFKHLIRNNYRRLQGLPLDPSISRTNR